MPEHSYTGNVRFALAPGTFPRVGAWAIYQGKLAIVTQVGAKNAAVLNGVRREWLDQTTCQVDFVDAQGETTVGAFVPTDQLTQATHEDIPERRRPDVYTARKLGYLPADPSAPPAPPPPPTPTLVLAEAAPQIAAWRRLFGRK